MFEGLELIEVTMPSGWSMMIDEEERLHLEFMEQMEDAR